MPDDLSGAKEQTPPVILFDHDTEQGEEPATAKEYYDRFIRRSSAPKPSGVEKP